MNQQKDKIDSILSFLLFLCIGIVVLGLLLFAITRELNFLIK